MPSKWLIGAGTMLAALIVASIVIAVVKKPEPLSEGTPERAVQLYLAAVAEDDIETAHGLLSAELREQCTVEIMARRSFGKRQIEDSRVTLEGTRYAGDEATVAARVTTIRSRGPFGTSESSHDQRFVLSEEEGEWRFVEIPWPNLGCFMPRMEIVPPVPTATPTPAGSPTPTTGGGGSSQ